MKIRTIQVEAFTPEMNKAFNGYAKDEGKTKTKFYSDILREYYLKKQAEQKSSRSRE